MGLATQPSIALKGMLDLINELQLKQKVFSDDYAKNHEMILHLMNKILRKVIRETLVGIQETDDVFAEFLCHVFFRHKTYIKSETTENNAVRINVYQNDLNGEMWQSTKEPLYSLVVAAYVSNAMRLIYPDQEDFENNHNYYEKLALSIFDQMYNENKEKLEYHILAYDYESIYNKNRYLRNNVGEPLIEKESSREMLCVAYYGQCMKFISHVACQKYIKTRWSSGKASMLFEAGNGEIFDIGFILTFAAVLLQKPWRIKNGERAERNVWLYAFLYIIVCLLLDTLENNNKAWKYMKNGHKSYWWYWGKLIVNTIPMIPIFYLIPTVSDYVYVPFYIFVTSLSEALFTVWFIFKSTTTLKYFLCFDFFGEKIQLIKEMGKSIVKYISVLGIFWGIYAVCYLSLTEKRNTSKETLFWQIFQSGGFEILGEFRDTDRDGTMIECSNISLQSVNFTESDQVRCLFRTTLIPPLLFLYIMTTAIILINVVTAMLSHKYEEMSENAAEYSRFHKYKILATFEKRSFFPRPFNLILCITYFAWRICCRLWRICCRLWRICCNLFCYLMCICDYRTYTEIPLVGRQKYNIFNYQAGLYRQKANKRRCWGSIPKDVNVNKDKVQSLLHEVLHERGANDFVEAVQEIITDWKHIDQKPDLVQKFVGKFALLLSTELDGVKRFVKEEITTAMEQVSRSAGPMEQVSRSVGAMEQVSRSAGPMEQISRSSTPSHFSTAEESLSSVLDVSF